MPWATHDGTETDRAVPDLVPLRDLSHRVHVIGCDLWGITRTTDDEVAKNSLAVALMAVKQVAWDLQAHYAEMTRED